jgi:hypothetical protein
MKYVVIDSNGIETPIIFPETESHVDHVRSQQEVISAGFCRFSVNADVKLEVGCWGESIGLKVKSRGAKDEELILRHNDFSC